MQISLYSIFCFPSGILITHMLDHVIDNMSLGLFHFPIFSVWSMDLIIAIDLYLSVFAFASTVYLVDLGC